MSFLSAYLTYPSSVKFMGRLLVDGFETPVYETSTSNSVDHSVFFETSLYKVFKEDMPAPITNLGDSDLHLKFEGHSNLGIKCKSKEYLDRFGVESVTNTLKRYLLNALLKEDPGCIPYCRLLFYKYEVNESLCLYTPDVSPSNHENIKLALVSYANGVPTEAIVFEYKPLKEFFNEEE